MKLGCRDFQKWSLYKAERESRFDRDILILFLYAVLFSFVLGIITGTLFLIIEAVLMFIIYLSPRLSRFGNRYLKHMEANFFTEVRVDRIPEFPFVSMCIALLMIGSPLFSFWFLNAFSLFFVGQQMWLYLFIPIMSISVAVFHPLKNRWKEMGGKKWIFTSFLCLLYLLFVGISALIWWIVS